MNHWIVLPVLLPAFLAAFLAVYGRHRLGIARAFSLVGTALFLMLAIGLAIWSGIGEIGVYTLGDWPVPFGIVLVADRLSALMLLLLAVLAICVQVYAIASGWDRRGRHFHALFQFQLMGIAGAFLTGDLFNLFVFFEILLIASYGLLIHSGGPLRLRAGLQYVVYNLLGSTLFLFALGTIYASLGTLNMADLATRVAELDGGGTALVRIAAVLLLLVFAVKAAILPLHFWLPSSYAVAPGPVAALFTIMTKVGAYAIIRTTTLIFSPERDIMSGLYGVWLMPAALATLAIGMIGVLAARDLSRLIAFSVVGSMGYVLTAIALFTEQATGVALYYILHSVFATAILFMVADLTIRQRRIEGEIEATPPMARHGIIAAAFFLGGIALVGLPPLSGFVGKLLVLDAARGRADQALIWGIVLVSTLLATVGYARAGSTIYWKAASVDPDPDAHPQPIRSEAAPGGLALGAAVSPAVPLVALTVLAGPITDYTALTAAQLYDRQNYIDAVLGAEAGRPGPGEIDAYEGDETEANEPPPTEDIIP